MPCMAKTSKVRRGIRPTPGRGFGGQKEGPASAIVEGTFLPRRHSCSDSPRYAEGRFSWHAPCTTRPAVRDRNHLKLSENGEMNARASTPALTGEAVEPLTLGSVWGNDEGQDLAEYAILIGLIALVVVGAVTLLGGAIMTALWQVITDGLPF